MSHTKREKDNFGGSVSKETAPEKSLPTVVETPKDIEMKDNDKNEKVKEGTERNESDKDFSEKDNSDKEEESEEELETDKTSEDIDKKNDSEAEASDDDLGVKEEIKETKKDNCENDISDDDSEDETDKRSMDIFDEESITEVNKENDSNDDNFENEGSCEENEEETDKTSDGIDKKNDSDESEADANDKDLKAEEEKEEIKKDNSQNDSSDEESDESEKGLLDRPVTVTGCRARKQVERLEVSFAVPAKDKQIPEGRGQKLGDCPRIELQIAKHHVTDLKPLHRILFNRQGTVNDTKKNIRKFSGFSFDETTSEFDQKKAKMEKLSNTILKGMCEVLDIERGGTKEDIIMRLLQFLLCPSDSGKPLPKKKSSGRDKKKVTAKKSRNSNKKGKSKASDDEEDEIAPSEEEVSDANDKDEASDSEVKKKSKAKSKKAPIKVKTVKKEKPKSKKEQPKASKRSLDVGSDSSDDDEPIAKRAKIPDDDDIKELVKTILDKADLHEITMKKVIKQVYDTYPNCDLTDKKSFIKKTIKSVLKLNEEGKER